jgi:hypothetical protein
MPRANELLRPVNTDGSTQQGLSIQGCSLFAGFRVPKLAKTTKSKEQSEQRKST